jgi:hypothetical protein
MINREGSIVHDSSPAGRRVCDITLSPPPRNSEEPDLGAREVLVAEQLLVVPQGISTGANVR